MNEERRSSVSGLSIAVTGAILMLFVYILSPVPIFVLVHLVGFGENEWVLTAVMAFYYPLSWVAERSPAVEAFYGYQMAMCRHMGFLG